jgi:DNA-binding transcriptional MerR regulator
MPDDPYSLSDLARLADVTPRTVRYYVAQGLLPSPEAAGPATRYTDGHLARLRLIKRLQRDHLPLAEIRGRLERMDDEDVIAAAAALDPREPEPSLDRVDTLAFVRSLMQQSGVRSTVAEAVTPYGSPLPQRHATLMRRMESAPPAAARPVPPAPAPAMVPAMSAPPPAMPSPGPAASRVGADRSTWERLVIAPDVELHVRRPLDRQTNKRVDQLERIARELFEDP